jgi:hypothetical protein
VMDTERKKNEAESLLRCHPRFFCCRRTRSNLPRGASQRRYDSCIHVRMVIWGGGQAANVCPIAALRSSRVVGEERESALQKQNYRKGRGLFDVTCASHLLFFCIVLNVQPQASSHRHGRANSCSTRRRVCTALHCARRKGSPCDGWDGVRWCAPSPPPPSGASSERRLNGILSSPT